MGVECGRVATAVESLSAPGHYLCGLAWDGTYLWHSDQEALELYAIDRADGSVVRRFECRHVRADLTYDGSTLCQIGGRPKRLILVDRETGEVTGTRPIDPPSGRVTGVEFGPEGLWLVLREPTVVQLRDYPTMNVRREFAVPGVGPSGLTYAQGNIIFGEFDAGMLHVMDANTGQHLASTRVEGRPTGMTFDGTRLWYCDFPAAALRALDLDAVLS